MVTCLADTSLSLSRRLANGLHRRRWLQRTLLLGLPVAWLVVIYLGSLAALLVAGFWRVDTFDISFSLMTVVIGHVTL